MNSGSPWPFRLVCLLLIAITVLVYAQVRGHDFVGLDDALYLTENPPVLEGLSAKSLLWGLTASHEANWHPLTWWSHMLDVELFGVDPGWFHLSNLALHVLNSVFLLVVLRRMTGDLWPSALVAALFALHPLHVESVAWVSERKDLLSCFFWILTLRVWLSYCERGGTSRYVATALCLTAGLMAKPTLVTLPFVLLLLDYWPLRRVIGAPPASEERVDTPVRPQATPARLIVEKLPLFLLVLASSVVTYTVQQAGGAVSSAAQTPIWSRLSNAVVSYVAYLGKTFWPGDLSMFYPLGDGWDAGWGAGVVLGSSILLAGVTVLALRWRRKDPFFVVGWFLYLGTLVPMIGLVQVGRQAMADRYTYISLIGVFIVLAFGAAELARTRPRLRPLLVVLSVGCLAACLPVTRQRVSAWESSETLARKTLEVEADNWMGHLMMARALSARGHQSEAIPHLAEALRLEPDYPIAEYNLGNALRDIGQRRQAIHHYRAALRLAPGYAKAAYNLAGVHYELRELEEAAHFYRETIRLWPEFADAHNNLGNVYFRQDRLEEAREQYEEALRLAPELDSARENLEQLKARPGAEADPD